MLYAIKNINKNAISYFSAKTPMEAMEKLKKALRAKSGTKIRFGPGKTFLFLICNGDTYCVKNRSDVHG